MVTTARRARRTAEIARVLLRNRESIRVGIDDSPAAADDPELREQAAQLADDLESMGPAFVKLGQVLSTRPDLLPEPYLEALARLQDEVAPFPATEARRVFAEETGSAPAAVFTSFGDEPMASASVGQVHRAVLRDGRRVVVKIQRPGIHEQVAEDLEALGQIAKFLDDHTDAGRRYGFEDLLEQFRRSLTDELDYRTEAANLERLAAILPEEGPLFVPRPVAGLTTQRVLVMDEIKGNKVTELSAVERDRLDTEGLADALLRSYLEQIFVHGFFHADPHPGNVIVTPDGRVALVDLGMVGHLRQDVRLQLVRMLLAVQEGRGQSAAEALVALGHRLEDFDEDALMRDVSDLVGRALSMQFAGLRIGELVARLSQACGRRGLRPPPELALLARALLNLESVTRCLTPEFDAVEAIRRHSSEILASQMEASSGGLMSALVEARDFAEQLPGRVNRVMEALAHGELQLKIHAFDEAEMLRSLTKLANRLAMALVIAALVLGAALMTRSYPGVALGCFVVAGLFGIALLGSIVLADRDLKHRLKRRRRL
ncbi:MAG TPA: AarF/UbiB family protein [Acidimicrobiales bacterium]|nr:AarF/UbiB family protein [Acidimicrobiales bacterium]